MSVCSEASLMTEVSPRIVRTAAAGDDSLATSAEDSQRIAWQLVIDRKLIEWGRAPERLAEDELIPPTRNAIDSAVQLATYLQSRGWSPPLRVVPDGDGGIVLERWTGAESATFEIDRHGRVEVVKCIDGQVIQRRAIS